MKFVICDFDIVIDMFKVSWYCDVIMIYQTITLSQILANVLDFDIAIDNSIIS